MASAWVAVVGPGSDASREELFAAEEAGAAVAEAGAVLVCGGLGGVMEAACRGARAEGGLTIGILPGTDRSHGNPYLDVALPTGMGEMRNTLIIRAADVVIAIGGGFGTLSEIAFALRTEVPVVGLDTWELAKRGREVAAFPIVASPAEAVEAALRSIPAPGRG